MSEVVIAAIGRTPIGRAVKGSLIEQRPDDLGAYVIGRGAQAGPAAGPRPDRGRDLRLRAARRRTGPQRGTDHQHPGRDRRSGHHGQPLLRVVAASRPDGLPRHQGGRGLRVRVRRRRVEHPLAARHVRGPAGNAEPAAVCREPGGLPRGLHEHGRDGRERGRQVRHHARGDGPVRPAEPAARGHGHQGRDLRPGDHPGAAVLRGHHDRATTAPGRTPRWRGWPR